MHNLILFWINVKMLQIKLRLRAVFYKTHPGHGDQGWTNLSKLGPYILVLMNHCSWQ